MVVSGSGSTEKEGGCRCLQLLILRALRQLLGGHTGCFVNLALGYLKRTRKSIALKIRMKFPLKHFYINENSINLFK